MYKKILISLALIGSALLSGCASNASSEGMTYTFSGSNNPLNKNFIKGIAVNTVSGGTETSPLWKSKINSENFQVALVDSLKSAKLYHKLVGSNYRLTATIVDQKQQNFGLDLKSAINVKYNLQQIKPKKTIYNKVITSSYTATFKDNIVAVERLRTANKGAARMNIKKLIVDLLHQRNSDTSNLINDLH